jgi:anthranilate phosphoribosyltransferase
MSYVFRELLRKIGSGTHTSESLTRQEAALATRLMLLQEATPAQIGAFMIAHRIRRPTGIELAGMLDAYEELGPTLAAISATTPVIVFGVPYDGRSRTAPIALLTALILVTAGCPVILHGGDRMPTKQGPPLIEFWQALGIDWSQCSFSHVQTILETTGLGFVYLPTHFPLAYSLVPYRDQIGKRPPFATAELAWSPYAGQAHVIAGYVHPPTEGLFQEIFAQRSISIYTTVKGLEGSCDLPRERTAILGLHNPGEADMPSTKLERLHLVPREYGFEGKNVDLVPPSEMATMMRSVLQGEANNLTPSTLWNAGFYLWRCSICHSIPEGIAQADSWLKQGRVLQTLCQLEAAVNPSVVIN